MKKQLWKKNLLEQLSEEISEKWKGTNAIEEIRDQREKS